MYHNFLLSNLFYIFTSFIIDKNINLFFRYGANPNAKEVGCSIRPIHLAVVNKIKEAVSLLVTHGADLTARTSMIRDAICYRGTPIEMAATGPVTPVGLEIQEILSGKKNCVQIDNL